ncbi:Gibberellin 2-beta-dioxygenase 1 [Hibiscus syriacus]|uniref:gibberellin 2beta-dioxygenase n=1 Tax=Hibiscus syriacus TaxID=106335 RepID=A0A6A2YL67_HIBSY|nr:gibberellin 2-beta-dioxygenase 1-like [Hibiscus syriacus]KAE8680057.1 Gibberellin 2-beta-dioxygenase 1 [Hibiscus syriacus]
MVVLSKPAIEQFSYTRNNKPTSTLFTQIPLVDLSKPDSKHQIIKACEELGFFKVINHGVPMESMSLLESEATRFFGLPLCEKQKTGQPEPYGYGNRRIGEHGDVGWVEYLLLTTSQDPNLHRFQGFRLALSNYMKSVKKMACEILETMADGLKIQPRNVLSKLLMDEESDSIFRVNHYPPCPHVQPVNANDSNSNGDVIGFGEHTDPQIISVLRSNNTSGLQISLRDGTWISVPPDQNSFFINVGDSLQVMTNGRFKSVKHRVVTNSEKSRLSMIYFGGPPLSEKIAPLPSLMRGDQQSLYKEFTWFEYKKSAYNSRLADNRLIHFEKTAAS